ncbi:hypothetical protein AJ78_02760 [Emergomyces pasteurianus Ep9510]|uniref:Protein kinase domain-containing protein n=1 Tax=Emergomyces pasteurianus Ep9510 TaxID=1447872 RepID=A0A1J9QMK4_9EURO|nr:hypothetical protein AJ78_02760 [Emergomyces pasteurianus Ep9510]
MGQWNGWTYHTINQSHLKMFLNDKNPPSAILLEYIPKMEMIYSHNFTKGRGFDPSRDSQSVGSAVRHQTKEHDDYSLTERQRGFIEDEELRNDVSTRRFTTLQGDYLSDYALRMDPKIQELLAELERERAEREQDRAELDQERQRRQVAEAEVRSERRRREEAEALAASSKSLTLPLFLRGCHELLLAIEIVTDPTRTTQGAVTRPTNRRVPSHITLWNTFNEEQMKVWHKLNQHSHFLTEKLFPSLHQLDYVRQLISPISSEWDLRYYERETVENQVRVIIDRIYENDELKRAFSLRGSITFESHANLELSTRASDLSLDDQPSSVEPTLGTESSTGKRMSKKNKPKKKETTMITGGQADRFCIYRQDGDEHIPALAIEYKAPHKLTRDEIVRGLAQDIHPSKEVIEKDSDDPDFYSKRLVAAVITQLFSYMVAKGVRYGYVCTGEAFIFLRILDDPSSVMCSVCAPGRDVGEINDDSLHLTAVAQVLAFTLRALVSPPAPQEWYDAVANLGIWPVEYSDILDQTPPTARPKHVSPLYRGRRPSKLPPFQMTLRSRCRPHTDIVPRSRSSSPSTSPPPSPLSPSARRERTVNARARSNPDQKSSQKEQSSETSDVNWIDHTAELSKIKSQPYCSQQCLLALRDNGPFDTSCPNYLAHLKRRIQPAEFRTLIREQLSKDRGPDANCRPLYKKGSCGAAFKIHLSSHGYTLLAKGVERNNLHKLEHENEVYHRLHDIQGNHIPVCLGIVVLDPKYPYYYDEGVYTHMLLLSWAGQPISEVMKSDTSACVIEMTSQSLQAIHIAGILHGDVEPRNILWNDGCNRPMLVDFERAEMRNALSTVSPNLGLKRRRLGKNRSPFSNELLKAQISLQRCRELVRRNSASKFKE